MLPLSVGQIGIGADTDYNMTSVPMAQVLKYLKNIVSQRICTISNKLIHKLFTKDKESINYI